MKDLFHAMDIMVRWPALAAVPLLLLLALYSASKRRTVVGVALLWAVYLVYEVGMRLRVFCSGECIFRQDLKIIYPILAVGTCVAVVVGAWGAWERQRMMRDRAK